jgi:UrcA family protein
MKTSTRVGAVRRNLPLTLAFAIGALSLVCVSAHAANLDPITISAPTTKIVGRDSATNAPIEKVTDSAVVKFDPVTLTTNSGVALLKDNVRAAALDVCQATFSISDDFQSCMSRTLRAAQPEVNAAIARARSTEVSAAVVRVQSNPNG